MNTKIRLVICSVLESASEIMFIFQLTSHTSIYLVPVLVLKT